jgi:hypothetical protein
MLNRQVFLENAREALCAIVNDPKHRNFSGWDVAVREHCVSDVVEDIEQQLAEPDPVQAIRMRLIEHMTTAARFDVLVMPAPTPLKPTPLAGISGELTDYILPLRNADREFANFFSELTDPCESVEQMKQVLLMRYWIAHLFLHGFGFARLALNDYEADAAADWFRPCYYSLRIHREHSYRMALGLPAAIEGPDPDRRVLIHLGWLSLALEGHKDLRAAWEIFWTLAFNEPSPYEGSAVEW